MWSLIVASTTFSTQEFSRFSVLYKFPRKWYFHYSTEYFWKTRPCHSPQQLQDWDTKSPTASFISLKKKRALEIQFSIVPGEKSMYQRVDVVPVVSRPMVGMHLDVLQVIHHMAAKIQN